MTIRQKLLTLAAGLLAAWLLVWPWAIMLIWGFAELNGDVPTRSEPEKEGRG